MISKLHQEKNYQKTLKSCFKFMFITKMFKERSCCYVLETFFKCNDYENQNTQYR
jgi:hypothetical protein